MSIKGGGSGTPDITVDAFWRCRRPDSTKHWWRKVPAWKPQWTAHIGWVVVVVSCCSGFYGWAVMLLSYSQCMLYCEGGPLQIPGTTCGSCCGCHQTVVRCCCILVCRTSGSAVVILVLLGCWVWVCACDSERIWLLSPTNSTRKLTQEKYLEHNIVSAISIHSFIRKYDSFLQLLIRSNLSCHKLHKSENQICIMISQTCIIMVQFGSK